MEGLGRNEVAAGRSRATALEYGRGVLKADGIAIGKEVWKPMERLLDVIDGPGGDVALLLERGHGQIWDFRERRI